MAYRVHLLDAPAPTAERRMIMGCMCGDCQYTKICQDENGDVFVICCNRKSENFLKEISLAFDSCDFGKVEDYDIE